MAKMYFGSLTSLYLKVCKKLQTNFWFIKCALCCALP